MIGLGRAARLADGVRVWTTGQLSAWQRTALLAIVIAVTAVGVVLWSTGRLDAREVGYPGIFLINLIGSATLILPVPGAAVVCLAASSSSGLNPLVVGLLGGLGAGLGETTGYLAGKSGEQLVRRSRYYRRIRRWMIRCGGPVLFLFALIPNPVMDVAGIAAGSLGYPFTKYVLLVVSGKILRYVGLAYACLYGIDVIARWGF
ncbi:MAG: VTT domain-containing protein [Chloroflexi bacterium]|nr:VTT domain-containing protein [Chloroflexota bacterium]